MLSFNKFLLAEATGKNTHMTHIEDLVIYGGVKGARQAILALRSLKDMLAGSATSSTDVTVKWDGAPAVFAGIDPTDGKFFVAKKGIFNKDPKVYKSHADIDADTSGDLSKKLKIAFTEMSKLGITGVVQGDIMFTSSDIKTETIDGTKYITFHPNTILYAFPADSDQAAIIKKAKIGIVFHTSYSGGTFETMTASYGVDVSKFNKVSTIWAQDAELRDMSGKATLTKADTAEVQEALSIAGTIFQKIASSTLKEIEENQEFAGMIETYNNSFLRNKTAISNTSKHVDGLIQYVNDKFQKEADKRSTDAGKQAQYKKRDEILSFFNSTNKANLKLVFDLQQAIARAKLIIINKLDKLNKINTFVKTKTGFKVTGHEGFVAIDRIGGGAVKLVDRLEFSTNNFDPNIIKGWDSPSRG
jgi:hypothetical protein